MSSFAYVGVQDGNISKSVMLLKLLVVIAVAIALTQERVKYFAKRFDFQQHNQLRQYSLAGT